MNLSCCIRDPSNNIEIVRKLYTSGSKVLGDDQEKFPEQSGSSQTNLKTRDAFEFSYLFGTFLPQI